MFDVAMYEAWKDRTFPAEHGRLSRRRILEAEVRAAVADCGGFCREMTLDAPETPDWPKWRWLGVFAEVADARSHDMLLLGPSQGKSR
jgi:hypothetical protein